MPHKKDSELKDLELSGRLPIQLATRGASALNPAVLRGLSNQPSVQPPITSQPQQAQGFLQTLLSNPSILNLLANLGGMAAGGGFGGLAAEQTFQQQQELSRRLEREKEERDIRKTQLGFSEAAEKREKISFEQSQLDRQRKLVSEELSNVLLDTPDISYADLSPNVKQFFSERHVKGLQARTKLNLEKGTLEIDALKTRLKADAERISEATSSRLLNEFRLEESKRQRRIQTASSQLLLNPQAKIKDIDEADLAEARQIAADTELNRRDKRALIEGRLAEAQLRRVTASQGGTIARLQLRIDPQSGQGILFNPVTGETRNAGQLIDPKKKGISINEEKSLRQIFENMEDNSWWTNLSASEKKREVEEARMWLQSGQSIDFDEAPGFFGGRKIVGVKTPPVGQTLVNPQTNTQGQTESADERALRKFGVQ